MSTVHPESAQSSGFSQAPGRSNGTHPFGGLAGRMDTLGPATLVGLVLTFAFGLALGWLSIPAASGVIGVLTLASVVSFILVGGPEVKHER
jgi:hypothetical protein